MWCSAVFKSNSYSRSYFFLCYFMKCNEAFSFTFSVIFSPECLCLWYNRINNEDNNEGIDSNSELWSHHLQSVFFEPLCPSCIDVSHCHVVVKCIFGHGAVAHQTGVPEDGTTNCWALKVSAVTRVPASQTFVFKLLLFDCSEGSKGFKWMFLLFFSLVQHASLSYSRPLSASQ